MGSRGRPRKNPNDPRWAAIDAKRAGVAAAARAEPAAVEPVTDDKPDVKKRRPPRLLNGKPNPAFWREKVASLSDLVDRASRGECEIPKGLNIQHAREQFAFEAASYGIDPAQIMDLRTDAQKIEDAVNSLLEDPNSVFELTDEQVRLLEKTLADIDRLHQEMRPIISETQVAEESRRAGLEVERRRHLGKAWADLLRRLRRVRDLCRKPWDESWPMNDPERSKALWPLRYMLYVGRSTMEGRQDIFKMGRHMVVFAQYLHEARIGKWLTNDQKICPSIWQECPYDSMMAVFPPGTGKTTLAAHFFALQLSINPMQRLLIGHAQEDQAFLNLEYVTTCFDQGTPSGRRNKALFPGLARIERKSQKTLKLMTREAIRTPTIKAHGIKARVSGADADFVWFDDPCDQSLAEQDTERERVFNRMNGTWRARKRGRRTFELTTTTLWHHDDPNCRRIALSRQNKLYIRLCIQPFGGPTSHPPFKSYWPEIYPPSRLRRIFEELRNPRLYAAAYECNPQPDSMRKIKRLAFYDPRSVEHEEFMASAVTWVSLDPAATERADAKSHTDQASLVYAAIGDVRVRGPDGEDRVIRRLRILDAMEFHASQSECVAQVMAFSQRRPVHYVLCECWGTTSGTIELFEARGLDVVPYLPKNKQKGERLDEVAVLLDDSIRDHGLPGAVVEFPGEARASGALKCHHEYFWLERQIIEFGATSADNSLDAVTQLVRHHLASLEVGCNAFTTKVREVEQIGEPRIRRMIEEAEGRLRGGRAEQEDWDFMSRSVWSQP